MSGSFCLGTHANTTRTPRQLSLNYYAKSCPQLEQLVGSVTSQQFKQSPVSAPATIRLLFHDCFVGVRPIPCMNPSNDFLDSNNFEPITQNVSGVQGCDASILIASKGGSKELAEKDAEDNRDLKVEGFETVRKAKEVVEKKCPGVVSCADILVIAARDYVHLVSSFTFLSCHSFPSFLSL